MRNLLKSGLVIMVVLVAASTLFSQEMTKEEKRELLKETRSLLKNSIELIDENKLDDAMLLLDSLLAMDSDNADGYFNKGLIFTLKADTTAALAALEKGSQLAPLSTRIKILLAKIKIRKGDLDSAAADLDFILGIKPHESEALYLRGVIHQKKNETNLALERFKKALDSYYAKGTK